jgi:hypothetical protein
MTRSKTQTIRNYVVLAVAVLAAGVGIPGCGNPGESSVTIDPKVRERIGKGPQVPTAASGKTRPEPPGIKSVLRRNAAKK